MLAALAVAPPLTEELFSPRSLAQLDGLVDLRRHEGSTPTQEDLIALAGQARILISSWRTPQVDETVLASCPNLEVVMHGAGSVKPVVSDALWARGIRVSSAAGPLGKGVAESALAMTITSLKNHWRLVDDIRAGGWHAERARVRELYDITVGVISAGNAGRHYITLLQAFDVEVLLVDPAITAEQATAMGARKVELDELVGKSDVIAVHAPSIPATRHMINSAVLQSMKDDAILINTARGSVIDEAALATELAKGRLFACLDVSDPEPPAVDHPLRSLPNCVFTGHVAGAVTNGKRRLGQHVADEVQRFLAGEPLAGEVTGADMARLA
ncbi:hydroxyacid dehydrogenase [Propionibacteriaceae bacterium Y1685]|uniref:hydroxyacid dehydrogenase n=1 Tax=Microlunatus sp. Y1700 TaxID=3418487 RepID=UPI003B7C7981